MTLLLPFPLCDLFSLFSPHCSLSLLSCEFSPFHSEVFAKTVFKWNNLVDCQLFFQSIFLKTRKCSLDCFRYGKNPKHIEGNQEYFHFIKNLKIKDDIIWYLSKLGSFKFRKIRILKVSKSQKQIMASWILPKNEREDHSMYWTAFIFWKNRGHYRESSLSTIFGILKKSYYAKFVLVSTT